MEATLCCVSSLSGAKEGIAIIPYTIAENFSAIPSAKTAEKNSEGGDA